MKMLILLTRTSLTSGKSYVICGRTNEHNSCALCGQGSPICPSHLRTRSRTRLLAMTASFRSRMPTSANAFPMNFKLQGPESGARDDPDSWLPHAQTCFFSLSLPKYSSKHVSSAESHGHNTTLPKSVLADLLTGRLTQTFLSVTLSLYSSLCILSVFTKGAAGKAPLCDQEFAQHGC